MRIFSPELAGSLLAFMVLAPVAIGAENPPPFASATEAYREGTAALQAGRGKEALPALTYAADRGVLGAELKLARAFATGDGLERNDAKAFSYYQQIADEHADITPLSPVAQYVAEAFVALGQYWLDGVPSMRMSPDPTRAAGLFRHAASYFGDAEAQYRLGRLYLTGDGVDKNTSLAANWLAAAAKKQHAAAQATLGQLLWESNLSHGKSARGLALIMLAHQNAGASGEKQAWIDSLYAKTMAAADTSTLKEAELFLPEWGGTAADAAEAAAPAKLTVTPGPVPQLVVPASGAGTTMARPAVAERAADGDEAGREAAPKATPVGMSLGSEDAAPSSQPGR